MTFLFCFLLVYVTSLISCFLVTLYSTHCVNERVTAKCKKENVPIPDKYFRQQFSKAMLGFFIPVFNFVYVTVFCFNMEKIIELVTIKIFNELVKLELERLKKECQNLRTKLKEAQDEESKEMVDVLNELDIKLEDKLNGK